MSVTSFDAARPGLWARIPTTIRAVIVGFLMAMVAANVWSILLLTLDPLRAAIGELLFLTLYLCWASGAFAPRATREARRVAFRVGRFTAAQWRWSLLAAGAFAVTVHAALVVLFRLVPFPVEAFRQGYDLSSVPTQALRWVVVVISALSAGVCEETGFRGYMQRPIETKHGPLFAILVSSTLFTCIHLAKAWSIPPMVPIVFGAGVLLGVLAWASGSLIPCILGHFIMDIGLFGFWWSGTAGTFTARPLAETGIDTGFEVACGVLGVALAVVLTAIVILRRARRAD